VPTTQVDPDDLEWGEYVGDGLTAVVHAGTYKGEAVAIKKLTTSSRHHSLKMEVAFLRELEIMSRVSHPNLVRFYGAAFAKHPYLLVSEFCSGGTAFNLLHASDLELSLMQKLSMALDVASAVDYLHTFNPLIFHRDLKSLNLLLAKVVTSTEDMPYVKVADFGMSKVKDDVEWGKLTKEAGTIHWMAPEVTTGNYDHKADIYSLAMVFFEILCQEIPYEDMKTSRVLLAVQAGQRPDLEAVPPDVPDSLVELMVQCWAQDPEERPSSTEVYSTLKPITRACLSECMDSGGLRSSSGSMSL
jgi:serine/threonine-protein kinase CTR1